MNPSNTFHSIIDTKVRPFQQYTGVNWIVGNPYITLLERSVTYQFFPHFHPYVVNLIQNLNDGGIAELQETDTIYLPDTASQPDSGKPLVVQPNTTRAILLATVPVVLSNGTTVNLTPGTPLTLQDKTSNNTPATIVIKSGTSVIYTDGSTDTLKSDAQVTLPGQIPISTASGIQWNIAGKDTVIPDGTPAALAGAAQAVLSYDGSTVTLPDKTSLAIRSGLPTPRLFEQIFNPPNPANKEVYGPDSTAVQLPYPVKDLDFSVDGAYSIYNWEIFFQVPLLIAVHLSQNQKFQDAQNWFHYIFNPTDNSDGPTPQRFWRVKPFQSTDAESIEEILVNLSTGADPELQKQTIESIQQWKNQPFQPWAVAQFRPTAYMLKTVMAYLDNLIAWGDSLFRQYTIETINEATQLYVLAANILGPKPQAVPKKGSAKSLTYAQMRGKLNAFSEMLANVETDIPFDLAPLPNAGSNPPGTQILPGIGQTLYFCIPQNDQLLGYWDTVANRLFNIHNSLNLQGIYQQLPLYDPPIDPALLVRAAAEGLDVNAIVSGLNQPLPLVRFRFLIAKAVEICQAVQSLGASLLAAMEKQDNESIARLRSQHESILLGLSKMIKYSQSQDATKARQAIEQTYNNAVQRFTYYQQLLGRKPGDITKDMSPLNDLDSDSLQKLNFSQAGETGEPQLKFDAVNVDISADAPVSDGGIQTLSGHEVQELNLIVGAEIANGITSGLSAAAAVIGAIPKMDAKGQPMGVGITIGTSGLQLAAIINALADVSRGVAEVCNSEATQTAKAGSYERRAQEWQNQSNLAKGEINQIYRQWRGAQIREAIAQQEYQNHLTQIQQAQDIETFLEGQELSGFPVKETTVEFYSWMKRETKTLYSSAFQLAFEAAKKAERALQNELGDSTLAYVQYNYLDGIEGLLAGDKLLVDLRTMEMAYHDLNQREYELTKHVSLMQVAPLALLQLRATGTCLVTLPEELFDLDCPGHYFRRIKSVALTIPCVTGPYTSVNCTLSLQKSSIRTKTDVANGYARAGANDSRFNDYYGAMQTIVTSTAQSDSGLFETNDERYVPFEVVGVAGSEWQLTLPSDVPQFDFDTITDVILHIRFTAREGGAAMKAAAVQNLQTQINKAQTVGSVRLFSMRHEFPSEWAKFAASTINKTTPAAALSFSLLPQHYPFWAQGLLALGKAAVNGIELLAEMTDNTNTVNIGDQLSGQQLAGNKDKLSVNPSAGGLLTGSLGNILKNNNPVFGKPTGSWSLYFDNNSMKDIWLAVTWGKPPFNGK
jgi:hypothetical protein